MKNTQKNVLFLSSLVLSSAIYGAPYLNIQGGIVASNLDSDFFKGKHETRPTGRISGGFLGCVTDNLQLGMEAGAQAFKNQKNILHPNAPGHLSRWSMDVLGVVDFYTSSNLNFFGKAGFAYVRQSTSADISGFQFSHIKNAIVPEVSLGVGYTLTDNFNVNLSLSNQFSRKDKTVANSAPSAASMMVGVKYSFA